MRECFYSAYTDREKPEFNPCGWCRQRRGEEIAYCNMPPNAAAQGFVTYCPYKEPPQERFQV